MTPTVDIRCGDVRNVLAELPAESVQTCITSPPYWGLRDYGVPGQLGLEPTPDAYVAAMVDVFRDVQRVLKNDGTLWLNLGDSYAGSWGAQSREHAGKLAPNISAISANQVKAAQIRESGTGSLGRTPGLKAKDLIGIPWRVAFALQADGWYLRAAMPWLKRNGMPESNKDRPTTVVESLFLLTKEPTYYYDATATVKVGAVKAGTRGAKGSNARSALKEVNGRPPDYWEYTGTRLRRSSDWFFESFHGLLSDEDGNLLALVANTRPYKGAHFATFPPALVEPCILAGSRPGDTVLDPFAGSGTTGAVAVQHGRSFIGCELNPEYLPLIFERIGAVEAPA